MVSKVLNYFTVTDIIKRYRLICLSRNNSPTIHKNNKLINSYIDGQTSPYRRAILSNQNKIKNYVHSHITADIKNTIPLQIGK